MKIFYFLEKFIFLLFIVKVYNANAQTKNNSSLVPTLHPVNVTQNAQTGKKSSPFDDAVKVWNFADSTGLTINGAAKIGVKMTGPGKAASLERGGDGYAAEFNGGWLVADSGVKISGKQMTLLVRARDFAKAWRGILLARAFTGDSYANLLYGSTLDLRQLGFRERARMKDGRSIEFLWQTDPLTKQATAAFLSDSEANPYKLSRDSLGRNKTWTQQLFPQLYPSLRDGVLKVAAPLELVGSEGWHDILVRFMGPRLDLFIDGVLVDEEYPHGDLRYFQSPFIIGAGFVNGVVTPDFHGQLDHIAVWDRALNDSEVFALSGGRKYIAKRRVEIEGAPVTLPQYWRPPGYNEFFGDPMPFFHDSSFHIFYLLDRKHHSLKWGVGAHAWGHLSSTDLIHWQTYPRAIDLTKQTENSLGTGNIIFHDGKYFLFYINHGRRLVYSDGPDDFLTDNIYMATSSDGIHFEKQAAPAVRINYRHSGDINPFVWRSASKNHFYMYVAGAPGQENWYFESEDLRSWRPAKIPALDSVHAACCSYYPWNGLYYWFDWYKGYRRSLAPIENQDSRFMNFLPLTESWAVPQAAPYTGNRMLMVGFTLPVTVYGSQALIRELVQNDDSTLGFTWPAEMIPASRKSLSLKIRSLRGSISGDESSLRLNVTGKDTAAFCFVEQVPENVRITLRIIPEQGASGFGLCVRGKGDYESGKELCFEPDKKQFRYAVAPRGSDAPPLPGVPAKLVDVKDLDKPFTLDIIVKDDFVDVCINNRYTLFHQRPDDYCKGDRLFFFVRKGAVNFESISIRPLKK